MKIDLTNPEEFTIENVRSLIASKDDSEHRQLRVSEAGIAYLSDEVGNENLEGVKFRFETWCQGNGYSGKDAALDNQYVRSVFSDLEVAWKRNVRGFVDYLPISA